MSTKNASFITGEKKDWIEKLEKDSKEKNLEIKTDDFLSYDEFIKYFEKLEKIDDHNFIIGASFSYSWMPTILKNLNPSEISECVKILNRVKKGAKIELKDIETLQKCINNSVIGASKLLHFVNPEIYPILDSRVFSYMFSYIKEKKPTEIKPKHYSDYISWCEEIIKEKEFNEIYENVKKKIGKEGKISKIRALDLIAYTKGKEL